MRRIIHARKLYAKRAVKDRRMPIVIYTAYPIFQEQFASWSADSFVVKNGHPRPLKQAINEAVQKRGNDNLRGQ